MRESLAQRTARMLERHAGQMDAGARLPSEQDLAERFQVSIRTVREAVGQLVACGILDRRHGSGTFVRTRPPQAIAIRVDMDLGHPGTSFFYLRIASQCQKRLEELGYDVRTFYAQTPPGVNPESTAFSGLLSDIRAGRFQGLVQISQTGSTLPPTAVPIPVAGTTTGSSHGVRIDRFRAFDEAVRWLRGQGRRKVGILRLSLDGSHDPEVEGLLDSLSRNGFQVPPENVVSCGHPALERGPVRPFDRLWAGCRGQIDALVVTDDLVFRDALPALLATGRSLPSDLTVVAHSNRGSGIQAPFSCALIETDPDEFAEALVEVTLDAIRGGHPALQRTVTAKFLPPSEEV